MVTAPVFLGLTEPRLLRLEIIPVFVQRVVNYLHCGDWQKILKFWFRVKICLLQPLLKRRKGRAPSHRLGSCSFLFLHHFWARGGLFAHHFLRVPATGRVWCHSHGQNSTIFQWGKFENVFRKPGCDPESVLCQESGTLPWSPWESISYCVAAFISLHPYFILVQILQSSY